MSKEIEVASIDGLYDERDLAELHDINNRKWCWSHIWITASLSAEVRRDGHHFSWHLAHHDWQHPERMKSLSQPIRFCRNCKVIDCVHILPEEANVKYIVRQGKFTHTEHLVQKCLSCNRRILTAGCTVCEPSRDGMDIVRSVAKEMGVDMGRCGSGFFCELPVQVSEIAEHDQDMARSHAKQAFLHGVSM